MKQKLLLFALVIASLVTSLGAGAQETVEPQWTLKHREAILLNAYTESDSANLVIVSKKDLKTGRYTFAYKGVNKDSGYLRTLMIVDPGDKELFRAEKASFSLSAKQLKKMLKQSSTVRIYTMAIPSDPAKAAIVRVRRVHLVTIRLK